MATLDPRNPSDGYRKAGEDRYWKTAREVLKDVFNADPNLVDQYRRDLMEASPEEQAIVYHSEALDVAADLANIPVTREHVDIYRKMIYDLPPVRHQYE